MYDEYLPSLFGAKGTKTEALVFNFFAFELMIAFTAISSGTSKISSSLLYFLLYFLLSNRLYSLLSYSWNSSSSYFCAIILSILLYRL